MTNEMKTATLIRRIMGEIAKAQAETIYELFGCDYNDLTKGTEYGRSCAKWYLKIKRHFRNLKVIRRLNAIIEFSFKQHVDLDKDEDWLQIMRAYFSPQSILKERTYTQVPQMAAQDESRYEGEEEEPWTPFEKIDVS